jgi:branched-chain amino acid transport system ATP-binding protein
MLRLENVSCGYAAIRAVHDVSFQVPPASVFALLGPNGAGKTTTIMAIMGHVDVHGGRILFEGHDITRRRAVDRAALGIALVPEGRQLFADLTVDENLTVGGYAKPLAGDAEKRARVWGLFPILRERRAQLAGTLSGGEQQMLAIGRAMMAEPRLLIVDELSLGLMPKMVDLCLAALLRLREEGMTVLLVDQNTRRVLEIADEVCVLASGVAAYRGSARAAGADPAFTSALLGITGQAASRAV